jgi:hypothetical protein
MDSRWLLEPCYDDSEVNWRPLDLDTLSWGDEQAAPAPRVEFYTSAHLVDERLDRLFSHSEESPEAERPETRSFVVMARSGTVGIVVVQKDDETGFQVATPPTAAEPTSQPSP